ncbi:MAG: MFS transporter [Planctomycetota bacterium]
MPPRAGALAAIEDIAIAPPPVAVAVLAVALVAVLARELRHVPKNLLVLMAAAFLDMVGLFVVVPILPFYVQTLAANGGTLFGLQLDEGKLTGLVVAAFTAAQLVSAPFWGRLSDSAGRRPVLLIALLASAAAFLLFGFAESLWLLMLSRLVQGAGGGTVGVIQAYVADTVPPEQRARALGWLSAATNLGVALGPVLGSATIALGALDVWPADGAQTLGRAAPGVVAALLCLLNVLFAFLWLPEPARHTAKKGPPGSPFAAAGRVLAHPGQPASRLLLVYAIAIGAAQGVNPVLVLFLGARFGVTEHTIGSYFLYIGALSVFARVLVLGRLVDRLGEARLSRVGLTTLACGLAALPFTASLSTLALATALLPVGMALTFPCVTALLSKVVPASERGMYMGLQQTFGGVARLLAPVAYGVAWDELSLGAPFWLAAGFVAATLLLARGIVTPPRTPPPG